MHYNFYYLTLLFIFSTALLKASEVNDADKSHLITLESAYQLAIERSPLMEIISAQEEEADGKIEQAGLLPNPELQTEFENFGGSGPFDGAEGLEITAGISQSILLGGKIDSREEVARRQRGTISYQRDIVLANLRLKVEMAFNEALLAQEQVKINEELLSLAKKTLTVVKRLVKAAHSSKVDLTRAQLAVQRQELLLQNSRRKLLKKLSSLTAIWGEPNVSDFILEGELWESNEIESFSHYASRLSQTPDIGRFSAEHKVREAELELEKANAVPDLTVFLGGRYFNEGAEKTMVGGFSIPLPVFNRNQGNIHSARARLRSVDAERENMDFQMRARLSSAYQDLKQAFLEIQTLQTQLIPTAEIAFKETEEGYERGRFILLDVLESRKVLFELKQQYLDGMSRYQASKAQIKRLTTIAKSNS